MGPVVDRQFARIVAYKRLLTGTLALAGGTAVVALAILTSRPVTPLMLLGVAIFYGGGAWALRDGIRLRRELQR